MECLNGIFNLTSLILALWLYFILTFNFVLHFYYNISIYNVTQYCNVPRKKHSDIFKMKYFWLMLCLILWPMRKEEEKILNITSFHKDSEYISQLHIFTKSSLTALACYLLIYRHPQKNNKDKSIPHTQCLSHKFLNQGPENEVTFYFFPVWSIMIYLGHLGCVLWLKRIFAFSNFLQQQTALKSIREEMAFEDKISWEPTHSKQQLQFCQLRKLKIFTMLLSKPVASVQLPTLSKNSLWHSNH